MARPWPIIFFSLAAGLASTARADDALDAKTTAIEFFRALQTENAAYVAAHFSGNPSETKLLKALRTSMTDCTLFRAACTRRFGSAAYLAGNDLFDPAAILPALQQMQVTITGDTAHLSPPGADTDSLTLKKIDATWRVTSLTGTPGKSAQMRAFLEIFLPAVESATAEVSAGKFASMDAVRSALKTKVTQALANRTAAAPATAP